MKCKAIPSGDHPCGIPATRYVSIWGAEIPMCTRHANITRRQAEHIPVEVPKRTTLEGQQEMPLGDPDIRGDKPLVTVRFNSSPIPTEELK